MMKLQVKTVRILALMLGLASVGNLSAQRDLKFGILASPMSFSWLSTGANTKVSGVSTLWGTKLGLQGEMRFRDNYSFSFGVNWNFNTGGRLQFQDSAKIWTKSDYMGNNTFNNPQSKAKMNLQFLEIPLGLHLRTQEFGRVRYYANPSFYAAFRTGARGEIVSTPLGTVPVEIIKNEVSPVNFSWGIGGGIEYSISNNTAFQVGLHYQGGLTDITSNESTYLKGTTGGQTFDTSSARLRNITIRTAILF